MKDYRLGSSEIQARERRASPVELPPQYPTLGWSNAFVVAQRLVQLGIGDQFVG